MNRTVYNILFYTVLPFIMLRLLWRSLRAPAYARRWGERLGLPGAAASERARQTSAWIWVHTVSVGETIAAAPMIRSLLEQHPAYGIVVTTMTPTGSAQVRELFEDQVCHVYAPYDYPGAVKRFLRLFRPSMVILMETELWPNIVHYSKRSSAQVLVINARLSARSMRGYEKFSALARPMLQQIDCIAAQAAADAERFRALGVSAERLRVTGSVKFELELPADLEQKKTALAALIEGQRPVWVAASTRASDGAREEEQVLAAFQRCLEEIPELLLILVPRHPERFNEVARLCAERGLSVVRRSTQQPVSQQTQVFLGDSMGEMLAWFSLSDVAFVGGSLVNTGCHNVLEPAALGVPVLVGPSQFNFQTICEQLQEAGALKTVPDEQALARAVLDLLRDEPGRQLMGEAGQRTVAQNRGALQRILSLIAERLPPASD